MLQSATDLQQLRGVGPILAKRLFDAGFDSFDKLANAREEDLLRVRGFTPRMTAPVLEQAKQLARTPESAHQGEEQPVQRQLSEVRHRVEAVAQSARERFQRDLSGKKGKKLSADLVRIEDALLQMQNWGRKRAKRVGKALEKLEKRVAGLEDAGLKKVCKGLKRARKAVLKTVG